MEINENLKEYINKNIFPEYEKNEEGHNIKHINYVINRSLKFAKEVPDIDVNMVYTIAAYHDIGHHIDAKNHEKVSAEILKNDMELRKFFTEEQICTMEEAVEEHRSSSKQEPRSIYGKIVASADKNTEVTDALMRTYSYTKKHNPTFTLEEIFEECRHHLIEKFCSGGYATKKMYFKDEEYEKYLKNIEKLTSDKEKFIEELMRVNNL